MEEEQTEVSEDTIKDLNTFAKAIKQQVAELKEFCGESVTLRDDSLGFVYSASSLKFDSLQLTNVGLEVFNKFKENKLSKIPLGVG